MVRAGVVVASLILWVSSAWGQDQLSSELMGEKAYYDFTKALEQNSAVKWEPFKKDATAEEVKTQLERAGWDTGTVLEKLEGGTQFDLYQKAIGPGEIGYMAVPKAGLGAAPSTFLPTDPSALVLAAGASPRVSTSFTATQIKSELVRGIETGLATFCGLQAKPSTVTMTVSAFGVVDVEATWNTAEVFPGMQ